MVECRDCDSLRPHKGRGLCNACYSKRHRRGTLEHVPRVPSPGRTPKPVRHGDWRGWWQHRRRHEPPCPECVEAKRAYDAEQRQRADVKEYQRRYQPAWRARKAEGRITIPSVIVDVLETVGQSMGWRSLFGWVNELHPEWSLNTVQVTLSRMVKDGRVVRVEFGEEIRYRLP